MQQTTTHTTTGMPQTPTHAAMNSIRQPDGTIRLLDFLCLVTGMDDREVLNGLLPSQDTTKPLCVAVAL